MRVLFTCCLIVAVSFSSIARNNAQVTQPGVSELSKIGKPLCFIENKGQITDQDSKQRPDIQYKVAATPGMNIFIGECAIHYQFARPEKIKEHNDLNSPFKGDTSLAPTMYDMYRMDVELVGANKNAEVVHEGTLDYYENYYTAPVGIKGATAHAYTKIIYKDVYKGIDWVLYMSNGQMKHEFVIRPGGRISDIEIRYNGAESLKLNKDGSLTAGTPQGTVTEEAPNSYDMQGKAVKSSFVLNGNILSYNADASPDGLVIDPTLIWATYYGGSGNDVGTSIVVYDTVGVYMAGQTDGISGIATTGAYQTVLAGYTDAFLTKFSHTGVLNWATYYGGSDNETQHGMSTGGGIYIVGDTRSLAGIATPGAPQITNGGGIDVYVANFNDTGGLVWATYFGGPGDDYGYGVYAGGGPVFITGGTNSTTGIATAGAHQTTLGGGYDAFLVEYSFTKILNWATYYGGSGDDCGYSVSANGGDNYITGITNSTSGIATAGAYQAALAGSSDAFLARFDIFGVQRWGTYFGGTLNDQGACINYDLTLGYLYIAGWTSSTAGIATVGAYQTTFAGAEDAFVAKFDLSGALLWSTYYGGSGDERCHNVIMDRFQHLSITGTTTSTAGIATAGAYQTAFGGGSDAFVAVFNDLGVLQKATYYGGSGNEQGHGVATDSRGDAYITGVTDGSSGIATSSAYQTALGGATDAFLAKFKYCTIPFVDSIKGPLTVCVGASVTLSDTSSGGFWGSTSTYYVKNVGAVFTGISAGTATITYVIYNSCSTVGISRSLTVLPLPAASISGPLAVCAGSTITLSGSPSGGAWTYTSSGVASVTGGCIITGISPGTTLISYSASNTCGTAVATRVTTVSIFPSAGTILGPLTACMGDSVLLTDSISGGVWSSSNTSIATVGSVTGIMTGSALGTATISYKVSNVCGTAMTTQTISVNPPTDAGLIAGPDSICVGKSLTLSESVGGGAWSTVTGKASISGGIIHGITPGFDTVVYAVVTCDTAKAKRVVYVHFCNLKVENVSTSLDIIVVPNPTNGVFTLKTPGSGVFSVYTLLGQKVQEYEITGKLIEIRLPADLAAGMYTGRFISNESGSVIEVKLVYQR